MSDEDLTNFPYLKEVKELSWKPNSNSTDDDNYMDVVMIITRSVKLKQGSMGCIIVRPNTEEEQNISKTEKDFFFEKIIGASSNLSLFKPDDSDIHAEVAAIGVCSQNGNRTKGCTIYITMPPCKKCFGAIYAAGIRRIVTMKDCAPTISIAAKEKGIELVSMSREFSLNQRKRMNILFDNKNSERSIKRIKVSD